MEAMDLTLQQAADLLDAYRKEHKLARIVDPDETDAATASAIRPATRTRSDASRSSGTGSSSKSRRGL